MDLDFTRQEYMFRDEVRTFLRDNLPHNIADKVAAGKELQRDGILHWQAILNEPRWLAVNWPKEYGGHGWSAVERHVFSEACTLHSAPRLPPFRLNMLGPVLLQLGTEMQKRTLCRRYWMVATGGVRVMVVDLEQCRSITISAIAAYGTSDQIRKISMAKNLIGRLGGRIAEEAIQLHGGIGMTWEYSGSHYAKRLVMNDHQLDDRNDHIMRLLHQVTKHATPEAT